MEILQEAPKSDAFIPLSEHQSATPASFYLGPPVLHYHSNRCKVRVAESELNSSPALAAFARGASDTPAPTDGLANGGGSLANGHAESTLEKIVEDVEIWVASEYVFVGCNCEPLPPTDFDLTANCTFSARPIQAVCQYRIPLFRFMPYRLSQGQPPASNRACTCNSFHRNMNRKKMGSPTQYRLR